ncbi:MAG: hypothetical protein M1155_02830 [Patescibacteria group bacterium]|nr:hypothetical protein [Patescibacteria group bacterium]
MDLAQELKNSLNLEKLSQSEQEEIISDFGETLLKRIILRIYEVLSEQDKKDLEILTGGDEEKINEFLKNKVSNIEQIRNEELSALISDFKEFAKDIK